MRNIGTGSLKFTMNKSAYTIDEKHMVLSYRFNGEQVPFPIMMFVFLHELAHIGSIADSHEDIFWYDFKWLLLRAEKQFNVDFSALSGLSYGNISVGNTLVRDSRVLKISDIPSLRNITIEDDC